MRISFKITLLSLMGIIFCSFGYGQSEAELYMLQLLEEEGVEYIKNKDFVNLDNAMEILDIRKDEALITEAEFQQGIGKLMPFKIELRERAIEEKMAISDKNAQEYADKKAKGETTDMFDIAKTRLKKKLDDGKISQAEYDKKFASYTKRQEERKARKAGN